MFFPALSTRHLTLDTRPFSLSSLRTLLRALFITPIEEKKSVICGSLERTVPKG
jgi:hypothetical protein